MNTSRTHTPTIRLYDATDEESVLRLLRVALGETPATRRSSDFWRWKHFENPSGPSFVRVACDQTGEVVGLRAFMRWQFKVDGDLVMAVQAVDTATHPAFRRKGIFSALTQQAVEDARQAGISLIFNTPNASSRPGYTKLGWQDVGTVTPLFLVLSPSRFFSRLLAAGVRLQRRAPASHSPLSMPTSSDVARLLDHPEAVEKLVASHEDLDTQANLATLRSVEYLRWRYTQHPHLAYSAVSVGPPDHLRAASIFRINRRFGLSEAILSEILVAGRSSALCANLLGQIKGKFPADYMVAYAREGSFMRGALKRYGFRAPPDSLMNFILENRLLKLPENQKPRRLMVNPLSWASATDPLQFRNWALSAGDIEVF
jgi:predicted N-acetyltransferase YhbS